MRVHVDDLPRIESTSTSSTASRLAISVCLVFHRSRPAIAAALSREFATVIKGFLIGGFFSTAFFAAVFGAKASRAQPRLPFCGSGEAKAHRQYRPLRLYRPVPVIFPASQTRHPSRHADCRFSGSARGAWRM